MAAEVAAPVPVETDVALQDHPGDAATRHRPTVRAGGTTADLAHAIVAQARVSAADALGTLAAGSNGESTLRIRRLTGSPRGDPELAYYLDSWRRKVERVGNINYPSEARARGISGTLRLLAVIEPNGQLKDVQVLASSGHAVLDDGAMRIVNLAAPFLPFTSNMRSNIDQLEIERTWRFQQDRLTPVP